MQQRAQVVLGKRLQHKDFAPRKQRAVYLERGVFGGCADEDYAAFFHKRQESVLLRLVETVYLVYEQNRAFAETAVFLRLFHDLFYLLYAAGHGGEVDEVSLCPVGDDARKGSLAHTGRAPEYHRADIVALDESAQHLSFAKQMLLSAIFVQRLRTQARRKRQTDFVFEKRRLFKHHNALPPA